MLIDLSRRPAWLIDRRSARLQPHTGVSFDPSDRALRSLPTDPAIVPLVSDAYARCNLASVRRHAHGRLQRQRRHKVGRKVRNSLTRGLTLTPPLRPSIFQRSYTMRLTQYCIDYLRSSAAGCSALLFLPWHHAHRPPVVSDVTANLKTPPLGGPPRGCYSGPTWLSALSLRC